jgi:sporulation protein YlmC with PRC-barrel domain
MRAKLSILLLGVSVILALSTALLADDPPVTSGQQQPGMSQQSGSDSETPNTQSTKTCAICRVTDVIGMPVVGQNQETLGKIANLAVDHNTGHVRYIVIATEENKLVPIPWQALKSMMTKTNNDSTLPKQCTLNISKETLAKAPSFQEGKWPDFSDQRWVSSVTSFYQLNIAKRQPSETHSE